jgi:hypothetical protein
MQRALQALHTLPGDPTSGASQSNREKSSSVCSSREIASDSNSAAPPIESRSTFIPREDWIASLSDSRSFVSVSHSASQCLASISQAAEASLSNSSSFNKLSSLSPCEAPQSKKTTEAKPAAVPGAQATSTHAWRGRSDSYRDSKRVSWSCGSIAEDEGIRRGVQGESCSNPESDELDSWRPRQGGDKLVDKH